MSKNTEKKRVDEDEDEDHDEDQESEARADEDDSDDEDEDEEPEYEPKKHRSTANRSGEDATAATRNTASNVSMSRAVLFAVAALVAGAAVGWGLRDARAEEGASKAPVAADGSSPCDKWKDEICGGTAQESAACAGAKSAAELLPTSACQAALADVPGTLEKIKAARASCDQLVTKLCTDLGEDSPGCKIVKAKTPSIPPEGCKEMLGNYDSVLGQLKQMGQPRPGFNGPGGPGGPGGPRGPGGPGGPGAPGAPPPITVPHSGP